MKADSYQIYALSENALTIQLVPEITEEQIRFLYRVRQRILDTKLPDIYQIIVTFHELTVFYDSTSLSYETLREKIHECVDDGMPTDLTSTANAKVYKIPICYDNEMALDKSRMEKHIGLPFNEIIQRHHQADYTFYMMGFLPGFLYLGGLDERLACSRLKEPRQKVLSGSVGIAGKQTGIYPMDSPGGWNIIGRTPLTLFDLSQTTNDNTMVIQPLDKVQFVPIPIQSFEKWNSMTLTEFQEI